MDNPPYKRPIGMPKCGDCKFMIDMERHGQFCARFPPTPIAMSNGKGEMQTQSILPPVNPVMTWCGEHVPKILVH